MPVYLRISLGIMVVLYFYLLLYFLKRKTLALKYTLLWLFSGFAMGTMLLVPGLLTVVVEIVGIETPVYGLFLAGIFFLIVISMSLTAIVSKQTERIKDLAQNNAMLEKRVREIEQRLMELEELE
ncbi:hypothetical protein C823_000524 [Eubacterium plexicaudatum ASF492]|uniref:DUF2304 domain-containing protein n=1 Tax=Eubacterium plexicaudatum ASF492 TaxID=1235802 RepID=N1ZTG6_9FIRM|nr:hypothetical protein C823_000524 [Eubacterium plexicaudatum ASF492]